MRHVLGVLSSKSALLLQSTYHLHRISIIISRNLSTSNFLPTLPKTPAAINSSKSQRSEPSPTTTPIDVGALADQEKPASSISPPKSPTSDKRPLEPRASSPSQRNWTIINSTRFLRSFSWRSIKKIPPTSVKRPLEPRASSLSQKNWVVIGSTRILKPSNRRNLEKNRPSSEARMLSYIQFITTPTSDTPGTALILHFEDKRYLIGNVHEGLQRAWLESKFRALLAKDMFLTGRTEWRSNGGLLGMILSLADSSIASSASKAETNRRKVERRNRGMEKELKLEKCPKSESGADGSTSRAAPAMAESHSGEEDPTVRLHGGPNLSHTIATARSFIFRKGMPLKVLEHVGEREISKDMEEEWEPTWSDSRVHVWAMSIKPFAASELSEDSTPESPRKRGLGEFMTGKRPSRLEVLNQWFGISAPPEAQDEEDKKIRESAITQMFSSLWSRDNLIETPLRDLRAPAMLYVRDPVTKELKNYEGPTPDGTAPVPDINVLVREAWPGASITHLPPAKPSSTAMSYIIRSRKMRGKFNTAAAREKNVPSGPLWAALASGSSVQSTDGSVVTPEMVLGPSKEGNGVAVIDLPSGEYVHDLVSRPEWSAAKVMNGVMAIIWILGPGVVKDRTLIEFMEGQSGVQHIVSCPEHCPDYLSMTSAASTAIQYYQIDPARYTIPVHNNTVPPPSEKSSDVGKTSPGDLEKAFRPAKRGLRINLSPDFKISEDLVMPILDTARIVRETPRDALDLSHSARQEINSPAAQAEILGQNLPSPDTEIVCLGTGSALPSRHRNVSATLLRVPGSGSYLMDCGENTLGQLKRMYTAPQLAEVFRDLKLIWISHLHADHHLGLASVVKAWYEEVHGKEEMRRPRPTLTEQMLDPAKFLKDGKRLFIVGSSPMMKWLDEYSSVEDFGYDQLVPLVSSPANILDDVPSSSLEWNGTNVGFNVSEDVKVKSVMRKATGLSNLASCTVSHCWGAQAVSLTFPTGFKFSYSGDCRPSKRFALIGQNSTVLLHEATFDDELQAEAIAKKHSTTSEALGVGVAMKARRVILTHFSQRYKNITNMGLLNIRNVKLEDAEDVDDPSAGLDQNVEDSNMSGTAINRLLDSLDDRSSSQAETESQSQELVGAPDPVRASPTNTAAPTITSNTIPNPQIDDMRMGVAFDHMRIRVGDIIHLDKFTPALMKLYKETEDGAKEDKSAKEAFSDDKNDILRTAQAQRGEDKAKQMQEERAQKARKGQLKAARKQENKAKRDREKRGGEGEEGKGREAVVVVEEGEGGGEVMTEPVAELEKMRAVQ